MAEVTIQELTESTIEGNGVFDKMMQAMTAHLELEFKRDRIKGPEYATVYLSGMQASMDQSIRFLLERQNAALIEAQVRLTEQQILKAQKEIDLVDAQIAKMNAEVDVTEQQVLNLQCEESKCQAEILHVNAQVLQTQAETLNVPKQGAVLDQQVLNLVAEKLATDSKTALTDQQALNLAVELLATEAKTALTDQQTANAVIEGTVLVAQECKVRAEFDVLMEQKAKIAVEAALLAQKKITEQAQTQGGVFDGNSVIGKQTSLYGAQTSGFSRDAEQKVAEIMVKAFGVQATTVDGYAGNGVNNLGDTDIGRAINKALAGIGA